MSDFDISNANQIAADLTPLIKGAVRADRLARAMYSTDAGIYQIPPLCVVLPACPEDIVQVVSYAASRGIPVIPRGAGTGLAGECLGDGIVMDLSRFMNHVIEIDRHANEVTVQPGLVLEQLNRRLAPIGRQIGPDPASGNRATIGGMIGNNATGARSLKYGYTGDHLKRLHIISAQAQALELSADSIDAHPTDQPTQWAIAVHDLLSKSQDLIARVKPRCDRNGSGYNIYPALKDDSVDLLQLIAGSEGTLAIVSQATLAMVELPPVKVLLQLNFDSLAAMARAIPSILPHNPSTCELMDGQLLTLTRDAYPQYHDVLPDSVASLLVEFDGTDETAVVSQMRQTHKMLRQLPPSARPADTHEIIDPALQSRVWTARKAATPLLFRNKTATQPIPVIEDVAVDPSQLAEYLDGLDRIARRLGVPMAYYGHVGHGQLHPRPYLDLHKPDDVKKMRRLAEEVFKLAWSLGGTISGEHGEGLVRVSFVEKQYGSEMYQLFRRIKQTFDPNGILNPGKIINDDPDIMVKNLRFSHTPIRADKPTNLIFHGDELARETEQCNGNGLCRSFDSLLTMCPIFRATGDEDAAPRAHANLMRHWLSGLFDENIMQSDDFKRTVDLCVNCRMCAIECPSLVNIPKLMIEARAEYVKKHGLTKAQFILTRSELISRIAAALGPLANLFTQPAWCRRIMEWTLDLDRRRAMPKFAWRSNIDKLYRYWQRQEPIRSPVDKVAYFLDLYATYNDHQLGRAVMDVLRHNNIEVVIPGQVAVSAPAISYGDLDYARRAVRFNARNLALAVAAGYKIVCSEPTAALYLKQEYLDITDDKNTRLVSENTYELTDYLAGLHRQGRLRQDGFKKLNLKLAYHKPCHYQALKIDHGTTYLLSHIDGLRIEHLPNSCCGIAGTFGFQKKNFDLSMRAGAPMLDPLRQSDADYGLTECSTCKMQMELATAKKTIHPIKILAQAYGLL